MRETSGSIAQLALDGRAKELQGIGKTIEEKIVQIVEHGEIEALAKRKATIPAGVVQFMRLPGLGPKTAARIWQELGDHDPRRAEAGGGGRAAALAGRARRQVGGEDPEGARLQGGEPRRRPPPARRRPAGRAGGRRRAARASRGRARLRGRLGAPPQGDLSRPRPDRHRDRPGGADRVLRPAAVGGRRRCARRHEGDGRLQRRPPLRPARRAAGVVREPAPALHRLEGAQRRDARGRGAARPLHLRVRRDDGRDAARCSTTEDEDALYAFLGYQPIAPELRENAGELEAARRGELPALVELSTASRRPAHAHALVIGREEHARGDGRRGGGARLRVLRDHRSLALSARGPPRRAARGDRARARAVSEAAHPRRRRGEHPHERRGRRAGGGARPARLGGRLRAPGAGEPAHRARARGDGQPVRRLHRPPDRAPDRHARPARRRRRARRREGARDGRVPRDQRPARPARPARRARARGEGGGAEARRSRPTRTRSARRATSSSRSRRRGAAG